MRKSPLFTWDLFRRYSDAARVAEGGREQLRRQEASVLKLEAGGPCDLLSGARLMLKAIFERQVLYEQEAALLHFDLAMS